VVCQIVAAALLNIDQKLDREGIRLVLIGTSSPAQTKDYLDAWEMDRFPGQLVLDEKKASHLVFGCKRSVFQSLVAPMIKGVRRFGISGAMAGASLGAEAYSTVGDSWVQGGLFMLKDGQVVYAKPEKYPGDFPVAEEWAAAMRGVGASDELAAGQDAINYEVALNEWLEARKAKKKAGGGRKANNLGMAVHLAKEIHKEAPMHCYAVSTVLLAVVCSLVALAVA